jgi:membrane-associated protease RseP (regulator of RpoE activity)
MLFWFWFWLLLLGLFTYFIVRRSVANITRTPVWILWLVMMTPAFIWAAWVLVNGEAPMPLLLLVGPFTVCSILYWVLVQWGRPAQPSSAPDKSNSAGTKPDNVATAIERRPPSRPINKEEEANLQNCFPWSVFYLQNIEHRPQALICRGQLRTSPEVAYKTVRENIESYFSDRFLVVFQEGLNGKPFFALVPNPQAKTSANSAANPANPAANSAANPAANPAVAKPLARPVLALGLLAATLVTTTLAGVLLTGNANQELPKDLSSLLTGLPYALALMTVLGVHELGHYLMARRYQIRATLPYFIPIPPAPIFPFGTFGAFIQMRAPVPNRKALFDVGIAGPLAGFLVTLPILIWGLAHSTLTPAGDATGILIRSTSGNEPGILIKPTASLLLALLSKIALGGALTPEDAIRLHPVAIAGCLGLVVTALNLMPVGQLDGGHIVHAMFGQRVGAMIGQISRLLFLALSFVQKELLIWAILLFFFPVVDEPALNDVSELDNGRDFLGLLALTLLVVIILPAPPPVIQILF